MTERDWLSPNEAPAQLQKCLAVIDGPVACNWFFAECKDGVWRDLPSGSVFQPTHWMPLPLHPSAMLRAREKGNDHE